MPVTEAKINWVSENGNPVKQPKKFACEHELHLGRKLWFPTGEMWVQMWEMTDDEMKEAVDQWDVFSLEMPMILICPECAKKVTNQNNDK